MPVQQETLPIHLPIVAVQHDYQDVIQDVEQQKTDRDSFWISCFQHGSNSVHAKVDVTRAGSQTDGDIALSSSLGPFRVSCSSLHIPPTPLRPPRLAINPAIDGDNERETSSDIPSINQPIPIFTFDVSPNGQLLATGHEEGSIWVRPIPSLSSSNLPDQSPNLSSPPPPTPIPVQHAQVHKSSLTQLRFFPSGSVLLSASTDFSLRIISAHDLAFIPRTFTGHRRPITSTAIIDRGKNVLSVSKDGTIRLWDCASGTQIWVGGSHSYTPIRAMDLGFKPKSPVPTFDGGAKRVKENEVGTEDKLVFCALQNGSMEVLDLASKSSVHRHSHASATPLTAISYDPASHLVATGSSAGLMTLYDIRTFAKPLFQCRRNEAAIEDLAFLPLLSSDETQEVKLAVATHDGLPFILSVRPEGPYVSGELVGYNCDPCRTVRLVGDQIWVAGDDGIVRMY